MGRRKWKQYQDALIPKPEEGSDEDSMPSTDQPPGLKIKTIEQINEDDGPKRPETILESLIKRPVTQPKLELTEEPTDWKPPDKCYFCTDGEKGETVTESQQQGGATVSINSINTYWWKFHTASSSPKPNQITDTIL